MKKKRRTYNEYDVEQMYYLNIQKVMEKCGLRFEITANKKEKYNDLHEHLFNASMEVKKTKAIEGLIQALVKMVKYNQSWKYLFLIGIGDGLLIVYDIADKHETISNFLKSKIPNLDKVTPSLVSGKYTKELEYLLGEPMICSPWEGLNKNFLGKNKTDVDLYNEYNLRYLIKLCEEHEMDLGEFINRRVDRNKGNRVNRTEFSDSDTYDGGKMFTFFEKGESIIDFKGSFVSYEKNFLENVKIREKDIKKIRRMRDSMISKQKRKNEGVYYSKPGISKVAYERFQKVLENDFKGEKNIDTHIFEPCAGAGELVSPYLKENKGNFSVTLNDKEKDSTLTQKYGRRGINYYNHNLRSIYCMPDEEDIIGELKDCAEKNKVFSVLTNFPFSGKSTRHDDELLKKSYGNKNQMFPLVGSAIELLIRLQKLYPETDFYLVFFSKGSLFQFRKGYDKIFNKLTENFTLKDVFLCSGENFNGVSKDVTVAYSIWKLGGKTSKKDIKVDVLDRIEEDTGKAYWLESKEYKESYFLTDFLKYSPSDEDEIGIERNEAFDHNSACRFIKVKPGIGGVSQVTEKSVKKDLPFKLKIPTHIFLSSWKFVLSPRGYIEHPRHVDNSYIHLPDPKNTEEIKLVEKIATLGILLALAEEDKTGGYINVEFSEEDKLSVDFGKKQDLRHSIKKILFIDYNNMRIGEKKVEELLREIASAKKFNRKKELGIIKKDISKEIKECLELLGYWDYIPSPMKKKYSRNQHTLDNYGFMV